MMRMDWKEAALEARQRPLMFALAGGTVVFGLLGLVAVAVDNLDVGLAMAVVMVLFYLLTLIAHAER